MEVSKVNLGKGFIDIYSFGDIKGAFMEKLDFLIDYLIKENQSIDIKEIPQNTSDKKRLYRSLCNIREPLPISKKYIQAENEYLQEELEKKNITQIENIKTINKVLPKTNLKHKSQICLWQGDITTLKIDAIVNAANSQGLGCFIPCHKCIDNAIHSASGVRLRLECSKIMQEIGLLQTGNVFITKGYNLPSKYVIHTVGPIIYGNVTEKEISELKSSYINSLELAKQNNIKTIAFPCISTGEFRFPKELASKIAIETIKEYLDTNEEHFEKIIFNVFSKEDYNIYLNNLGEIYGRI